MAGRAQFSVSAGKRIRTTVERVERDYQLTGGPMPHNAQASFVRVGKAATTAAADGKLEFDWLRSTGDVSTTETVQSSSFVAYSWAVSSSNWAVGDKAILFRGMPGPRWYAMKPDASTGGAAPTNNVASMVFPLFGEVLGANGSTWFYADTFVVGTSEKGPLTSTDLGVELGSTDDFRFFFPGAKYMIETSAWVHVDHVTTNFTSGSNAPVLDMGLYFSSNSTAGTVAEMKDTRRRHTCPIGDTGTSEEYHASFHSMAYLDITTDANSSGPAILKIRITGNDLPVGSTFTLEEGMLKVTRLDAGY